MYITNISKYTCRHFNALVCTQSEILAPTYRIWSFELINLITRNTRSQPFTTRLLTKLCPLLAILIVRHGPVHILRMQRGRRRVSDLGDFGGEAQNKCLIMGYTFITINIHLSMCTLL